jgi:integral membrane protein
MASLFSTPLGRFRVVSLAEGVSYLVLLAIAMPLKYLAGDPRAVQVVGALHGALFVAFLATLAQAAHAEGWRPSRVYRAFVASMVPFGAFLLERTLRREQAQAPPER